MLEASLSVRSICLAVSSADGYDADGSRLTSLRMVCAAAADNRYWVPAISNGIGFTWKARPSPEVMAEVASCSSGVVQPSDILRPARGSRGRSGCHAQPQACTFAVAALDFGTQPGAEAGLLLEPHAVLLGQHPRQQRPGDKAPAEQDLAQPSSRALLMSEGLLHLVLFDRTLLTEE